ncbi:tRNA preQ1(34) S-adenosylmethionine ribosyltransferase-isomerase QueA [Chloroflexota bacterium]
MKTSDFNYNLPPELIAQSPVEPRDRSRLMVLNREADSIENRQFFEIVDYLRDGDVLVFNDSRVIPARLRGWRAGSGGRVEILLLRRLDAGLWEALVKPGKRLRTGAVVEIGGDSVAGRQPGAGNLAEIIGEGPGGTRVIKFSDEELLPDSGEVPLPPYIHTALANPERYQTVYARVAGSVAAPTAGLHFTTDLLGAMERKGVRCLFVTLHVGLDTFRPVQEADPRQHAIYQEYGVLGEAVAAELSQAKVEGRRIIAVGTTTVRVLEHAAQASAPGRLRPFEGWVNLFVLPGHRFRLVDALATNFHLPKSTLLMLVTAFGGKGLVDNAYQEAIAQGYRFYSFGDAMLIL